MFVVYHQLNQLIQLCREETERFLTYDFLKKKPHQQQSIFYSSGNNYGHDPFESEKSPLFRFKYQLNHEFNAGG